jgi:hypothetical protein
MEYSIWSTKADGPTPIGREALRQAGCSGVAEAPWREGMQQHTPPSNAWCGVQRPPTHHYRPHAVDRARTIGFGKPGDLL